MSLFRILGVRMAAEFLGTFWLVLAGCGTAVISLEAPGAVGTVGVALAFGLAVLTMIYAVGHVSGGHFNPAITLGLAVGRRFPWRAVPAYIVTQVVAAIVAASVLLTIAHGRPGFATDDGFASNGYGDHSPAGYSLWSCALAEVVLTAIFVYVVLGITDPRAPGGFAPIAIGLALAVINLVAIPITNASVNPARSTGPAVFAGTTALSQLWLFWLAPVVGGAIAGATYALITGEHARNSRT